MKWDKLCTIALTGIGACALLTGARGLELRSINQMPAMTQQDGSKVIIANIGTVSLNILYRDGDWKSVQIPSGQYVTVPGQGTGLSVSYNDGAEAQTATLNPGSTYALYWNSQLNRWRIALYDDVARRASPFRSH
jgi:hypothetical protein